jgi:hypothetical protein
MPPPAAAPLDLTPRQLLAVVHNLAAGMDEMSAAALANLPPDTVPRLRATPHFDGLLAECRAFDAKTALERDAVLQALLRRAVERALADDRVGAIAAALRLLGMLPQPRPAPPRAPAAAARAGSPTTRTTARAAGSAGRAARPVRPRGGRDRRPERPRWSLA